MMKCGRELWPNRIEIAFQRLHSRHMRRGYGVWPRHPLHAGVNTPSHTCTVKTKYPDVYCAGSNATRIGRDSDSREIFLGSFQDCAACPLQNQLATFKAGQAYCTLSGLGSKAAVCGSTVTQPKSKRRGGLKRCGLFLRCCSTCTSVSESFPVLAEHGAHQGGRNTTLLVRVLKPIQNQVRVTCVCFGRFSCHVKRRPCIFSSLHRGHGRACSEAPSLPPP